MNTGSKILAAIVLVVVVGFLVFWYENSQPADMVANTEKETEMMADEYATESDNESLGNDTQQNVVDVPKTKYSNGTLNVTSSYMSQGGKNDLGVSVTIKDDIITALTVTNKAGDKTSTNYQNKFISGINSVVVGKSVDSVKVGVVSGSSLTSPSFNDALAQVKAQAIVKKRCFR